MKNKCLTELVYVLLGQVSFPIIIIVLIILLNNPLLADNNNPKLKKVAILDFINIEQNASFQYLEISITEAVRNKLAEIYLFVPLSQKKINEIAETNYIFRNDFYTKSVAMHMGIISMQDVVIVGEFRVLNEKSNDITIITDVRIISVSKKKVISEFSVKGPADDRLWDTIDIIATRISKELVNVLPNKDTANQKNYKLDNEERVYLDNFLLGLSCGGFYYLGGYGSHFKPGSPIVGLSVQWNVPIIWSRLGVIGEVGFFRHTLRRGDDSIVQKSDLEGKTDNYQLGISTFVCFMMMNKIKLNTKIGGGWIAQSTTVTGKVSSTFANGFPYLLAGIDCEYQINKNVFGVGTIQTLMEIEDGTCTFVPMITMGIKLAL